MKRRGRSYVDCIVCDKFKKPWGRSAPMEMCGSYCDSDCKGYSVEPHADHLWPGEESPYEGCPVCEQDVYIRSEGTLHYVNCVFCKRDRGITITTSGLPTMVSAWDAWNKAFAEPEEDEE